MGYAVCYVYRIRIINIAIRVRPNNNSPAYSQNIVKKCHDLYQEFYFKLNFVTPKTKSLSVCFLYDLLLYDKQLRSFRDGQLFFTTLFLCLLNLAANKYSVRILSPLTDNW